MYFYHYNKYLLSGFDQHIIHFAGTSNQWRCSVHSHGECNDDNENDGGMPIVTADRH
jgi:hypothetical protein